jgi:flagellar basal-body rod modification protein FlgD
MTDVAAVTPAAAASPAGSTGTGLVPQTETLDYDAFLQLLVTQMKNQDPLDPISETEYVAQLANFSNVEQNIITNERLTAMMTANALGDSQGLIGRTVTTPDGVSGTVEAVRITAEGTEAILSDGRTVPVGQGVTVA